MKLAALILASAFATSLVGCATDAGHQDDSQEAMLLGTWMGNFHSAPTMFSFNDDGTVTEHDQATNAEHAGTYALVDGTLSLDFDAVQELRVIVSDDSLTFTDSHETLQRLSSCGGPNGDGI